MSAGTDIVFNKLGLSNKYAYESDSVDAPSNGKAGLMSIWNTKSLGKKLKSEIYDIGKDSQGRWDDGGFGIGRPIHLIYTDKGYLLINIQAPNRNHSHSTVGYAKNKIRINILLNRFLKKFGITDLKKEKIFMVGDFNDKFNLLRNGFELHPEGHEPFILKHGKGEAPKTCCYNWDSSCPENRYNDKINLRIEKDPGNPADEGEKDVINSTETQQIQCKVPDRNGNKVGLVGPNNRHMIDDDGKLIKNYRFTGDYCFAYEFKGKLKMFSEQRKESSESDHELVYLKDEDEDSTIKNPTQKAGTRRRKNRRRSRSVKSRRRGH
jgi:hypothetical protein